MGQGDARGPGAPPSREQVRQLVLRASAEAGRAAALLGEPWTKRRVKAVEALLAAVRALDESVVQGHGGDAAAEGVDVWRAAFRRTEQPASVQGRDARVAVLAALAAAWCLLRGDLAEAERLGRNALRFAAHAEGREEP